MPISRLPPAFCRISSFRSLLSFALFAASSLSPLVAQVAVVTEHNDIGRTSQNLGETLLNPANVNAGQFGKLFSQAVNGETFAQPLYVPQVTVPNKGVHNVVYVATYNDYVYAFDGDSNGGINAGPLWQVPPDQRGSSRHVLQQLRGPGHPGD